MTWAEAWAFTVAMAAWWFYPWREEMLLELRKEKIRQGGEVDEL